MLRDHILNVINQSQKFVNESQSYNTDDVCSSATNSQGNVTSPFEESELVTLRLITKELVESKKRYVRMDISCYLV